MATIDRKPRHRSLVAALMSFRCAFVGGALVSGMINLLALTSSFFMLQVYDRVIPSHSLPTLVGLLLLAAVFYAMHGVLEVVRFRLMSRIGMALEQRLASDAFEAMLRQQQTASLPSDGVQPLRDLEQARSFLAGGGPSALFDLPWMPLYLGLCFLLHPLIGMTTLAGGALLVTLTVLTEVSTRAPTKASQRLAARRYRLAEAAHRNADVLHAMGFAGRLNDRLSAIGAEQLATQTRASDATATIGTISRISRIALQSGLLAVGAVLVMEGEASGGVIIASSIIMGRALAPVELAIAHWKAFVGARQAWTRLMEVLAALPTSGRATALPAPAAELAVERLCVVYPGSHRLVVNEASFRLPAGTGLGIIGSSASGKSSLARAIAGAWAPARSRVRLDGASLDQWSDAALGRHVGYLPQSVDLFAGTVAENIARFEPDAPSEQILAAAKAAGVHKLIVLLPEGYDTAIGEGGAGLSAGQRQRIALARALYGDPFLVVLDEPNSNLDADGEAALGEAILGVRARGGIVVVVAHRPSALANLDRLLVMKDGRMQAYGPRDEVMSRPSPPAPLKVVAG